MDDFDPQKLILLPSLKPKLRNSNTPPRHKQGEKFLKGPIPWNWLSFAGSLPGKSLHVGLTIWFYSGLTGNNTIILSYSTLRKMGVTRYSAYRGLAALEKAGLVSAIRHLGRSPIVKIL